MTDPRAALINEAFDDRDALKNGTHKDAVLSVVRDLDRGTLRVATPESDGTWTVHAWIQKATSLYFALAPMVEEPAGPLQFYDKVPIKKGLADAGVRVVPGGVVRYGAFCERGVVVMPAFVNIGARVGAGTMVDTWATVGSCAQVGSRVHLSGGVGIGGVLEPPGARPVIIEDDCFIGSRSIVVEGVHIGAGAVLGANVVVTATTHIIDVRGTRPIRLQGSIPPNAVVIPGTRPKEFPAGRYEVPCALIIGTRTESTDKKTSLNDTLRLFAL
jgi:2,3,4,5-tetrahydropyridine-2-carboxylate N-succinyltransferase